MKQQIEAAIVAAVSELFGVSVAAELTRPDEQFGDYATNVALQLAKQVGQDPREVAETLAHKLRQALGDHVQEISVAGPGFLNLRLTDQALWKMTNQEPAKTLAGQVIVFEYSDPNPFKVLHAGHLYQTVFGDSVSRLLRLAGANVYDVNFGGDVGMHVGKTLWAILQKLGGEHPEKLAEIPEGARADWLSQCYVEGNNAFEDDDTIKAEMGKLNQKVYELHAKNDHDSPFARIYWTCRQWSYDYFEQFYARIGAHFDRYYPESQTAPIGVKVVREQLSKGVYEQSDGAVVFRGEKHGLHTRVFINSNGLPTYEAKDVGLAMAKWHDYHFDKTIIVTGNDIVEYMKVVLKSMEQFAPEIVERTVHLTHGQVKLKGGVKMSSRKGNILRATEVIDTVAASARALGGAVGESTVLGAVKYSFLKQRIGGDIIFDVDESVSLEGNSGPYLQYAHARARSILAKSKVEGQNIEGLESGERSLVRKMSEYVEIVDKAVAELMPHHVCTYLYDLAQEFNRFYEHNRVIGDPREAVRLRLVEQYANTLRDGLGVLGISAPDKM